MPKDAPWTAPLPSARTGIARTIYPMSNSPRRYDLALFEALNDEYAAKRIAPKPRSLEQGGLAEEAKRRVLWAHHHVDLRHKRVLEVGCGYGYEVWSMANNLDAEAYGVDVRQPESWEDLAGENVTLQLADLTVQNPFPDDYFDRVVSFAVWEHVVHPHALLRQTHQILKPGGLNWIRANLWAGPKASHRYRDVYFPWPHLLFSDDVFMEWDIKNGREPRGASWVNKLTWSQYQNYIEDIGYKLRSLQFTKADWDEEFYSRFEDVLGRIPRSDLERDFFTAVLEKRL